MSHPALPPLPAGHSPRAAAFWLGFHLRRNLKKRAFWLWALAVIIVFAVVMGTAGLRGGGLGNLFILRITPLLSLFFATGVLREEIEDQTLTYGFSRPVGRAWLYGARVVAALVPVALLGLVPAFIAGTAAGPTAPPRYLAASALIILAYGGVFALLGLLVRWPTWLGLAFLVAWEQPVALVPGFFGRLTLLTHARAVAGLPAGESPWSGLLTVPPAWASALVLAAVAALTFWLGGWLISRREYQLAK